MIPHRRAPGEAAAPTNPQAFDSPGDEENPMAPPTDEDGIRRLLPRDRMTEGARKLRDAYGRVPDAPLYRREFWLMQVTLERWRREEGMPEDVPPAELFGFDEPGQHGLCGLGWTTAQLVPAFAEKPLEDRGDHELVQDAAGRQVLFFKGRRQGFMPEYVGHPVTDRASWEENVKWRLDPATEERWAGFEEQMRAACEAAGRGLIMTQRLIGGYMYLRSLVGPEALLYLVYDDPELVHDLMRAWFALSDAVIARHQEHVTIDEIFFAEDICYNHGPLISPAMMREFLLPYYRQLVANLRRRQLDPYRHLYVQIDTDGLADPVIPVYREAIGMDVMSPFEVASGCDVVRTGETWPDLVIAGGIDKRVLATTPAAIDEMVERILPVMRRRGGYIPTVDHGTPPEVPYANYLHYRKRCQELGG
jgi:uroporphyrinogen-III decarboxylase